MHRSGTSCLAGSLEARGLDLGKVSRSDPHNTKGNRENLAMRALNEAVLEFSGGPWDAPPVAVAWNQELRARCDALLAGRRDDGRPWGFKDRPPTIAWPEFAAEYARIRGRPYAGVWRRPRYFGPRRKECARLYLEDGAAT